MIPCQIKRVSSTPVNFIGQALNYVTITAENGQAAVLKPYVMELPITIVGWDVLEKWGAHIQF